MLRAGSFLPTRAQVFALKSCCVLRIHLYTYCFGWYWLNWGLDCACALRLRNVLIVRLICDVVHDVEFGDEA